MALGKAQSLYNDVQSNELVMIKLKVTLNGIIEGLQSYQDLSIEGESKVIDSIMLAIDQAQSSVDQVMGRGFFSKYLMASSDKETISDAVALLECALESLMTKIHLANEGATRGQNITNEQINKNALKHLRQTENGM